MSFFVDSMNVAYSSPNGLLCTKDGKTLVFGANGNVTIPSSVTSIGDSAFYSFSGLKSVTIPNSVTSIGEDAFCQCRGLTSVTIPSSVTSIGDRAFEDCSGLTSVTIPEGVTNIGDRAFAYCSGLTSVAIPSSVTSIGSYAFSGCSGLADRNGFVIIRGVLYDYFGSATLVTIPSSVTSIGDEAFADCDELTSVTIPSSVTSIGRDAFYGCSGLTLVTIPSSVTSIGSYAFSGCSGLADRNGFVIIRGVLYDYFGSATSVTIPSSVTSIGDSAFLGCDELTSVTIPSSVTSIGDSAFLGCDELTSVTIPSSVTSIGEVAFAYCSGLMSVTIPSSVTSIGEGAFYGCRGLTSMMILEGVTNIGDWAFQCCSGLTSVTIPSSVTSIGEGAFEDCRGLISVTILEGVTNIGDWAFFGCRRLASVTIPSSVTSIGDYAFGGCEGLASVTILEGVTSIGSCAFECCDELKTVYVSSGDTDRVRNLMSASGFSVGDVEFVELRPAYTVVFIANGGSGTMTSQTIACGVSTALKANAFTRSGYAFAGWSKAAAGSVDYVNGASVANLAIAGRSITLYAVWKKIVEPSPVEPVDPPFVPPTLVDETGTVIDVEKGENAPYEKAAAVYDGYVYDAKGVMVGTVQVKVAKAKVKKAKGKGVGEGEDGGISATVTATVQLVGEKKKLSFKGGVADAAGTVSVMSAGGHELSISLGVNGVAGELRRAGGSAPYQVDGARNLFSAKDKEAKDVVKEIESMWVGAINVVGDDVALAVSVAKKGKVKVSGTVNGAKVTATSQLLVGADVCCVPVVITKKANLAFNLWLTADGTVKIVGLENAVVGKAGTLKPGAKFVFGEAAVKGFAALPGVLTEYLPAGLAVMQNKAKWVVAPDEKGKAAKMGKVVFDKKTGEIDKDKLGANPSGLKLTYTAKTGSFKGSFKAYCVAKGKLKSYTVNVTGVLVDGVGYGTATIKNFGSLPVVIDDVFAGSDDDSPPGGGSETDISPSQDTWLASALAYGYIDDSSEDTGNPNWPIERGLWAVTKDANGNCVLEVNSSFGKATFRSAELDDLCADVSRQYREVLLTGSGGETLILSRRFDLAWYFTDYDGSVTGGIFGNREFGVHGASDRFGAQQAAVVKAGVEKYVDVVAGTYRLRVSELSESSRQTQYGYYPYEYYFDDAGDLSSPELKLTVARDGMASVSGTIDRASVSGTTRLLFWTAANYANAIFWIPLTDGCEAVLFISFYSTGSTRVSGNGMILFD